MSSACACCCASRPTFPATSGCFSSSSAVYSLSGLATGATASGGLASGCGSVVGAAASAGAASCAVGSVAAGSGAGGSTLSRPVRLMGRTSWLRVGASSAAGAAGSGVVGAASATAGVAPVGSSGIVTGQRSRVYQRCHGCIRYTAPVEIDSNEISTTEASRILKVNESRVRQMHNDGILVDVRFTRLGRIFSRREVEALAEARARSAPSLAG